MKQIATIHCDGGARGNPGPAAAGFYIQFDDGEELKGSKFLGEATNNIAEYSSLLFALEECVKKGIHSLEVYMDSKLVIEQLRKNFKVKNKGLKIYYAKIQEFIDKNDLNVSFHHVPREKNKIADKLVNECLDKHD